MLCAHEVYDKLCQLANALQVRLLSNSGSLLKSAAFDGQRDCQAWGNVAEQLANVATLPAANPSQGTALPTTLEHRSPAQFE